MIAVVLLSLGLANPLPQSPQPAQLQHPPLPGWSDLDIEQRWVELDALARQPDWKGAAEWAEFLAEQREFQLLEWMCLYPPREGSFTTFSDALRVSGAPQWARTALWTLHNRDTHTRFSPRKQFLNERPGYTLDWLERHESELDELATGLLAELRQVDPPPAREDSSAALPPWKPAELIAHLAHEGPIEVLAPGQRARAGAVYVHQIERELRAVAAAQLYAEPVLSQLKKLTQSERAEVRSFAWLAVGEATLQALPPARCTDGSFVKVIDDAREDPRVRTSALMALSQRADRDPRAWFALHKIARDVAHPAWNAALGRLGDVGDEFTIESLEWLVRDLARAHDDERAVLVNAQLKRLRDRADPKMVSNLASSDPAAFLERTAWADVTTDPVAVARGEWTVRYFSVRRAPSEFRTAIEKLAQAYEPPPEAAGAEDSTVTVLAPLRERVAEWAKRLLAIQ